jgi:hypothetical protein
MKQTPVSYFYRSPTSLQKRHVNFDNIALVPASELASCQMERVCLSTT